MSARHCTSTASIAETISLEALTPELAEHAENCEACGHELERRRGLALVTARARRAFEQAPDLDPAAWTRVKAAVDAEVGGSRQPAWRGWLVGVMALAAGAAVVFWVTRPAEHTPAPGLARVAPSEAGAKPTEAVPPVAAVAVVEATTAQPEAPRAEEPAPASPPLLEVATLTGDVALTVGPGAMIATTTEGERYRLLGRHDLELAQGTRLRVRALEASGVELELIEGLASFDVNRAPDERLFRVHVDDVLIEVRGTFWSVERRATGVVVSVERGRVAVMREGEEEVLVEAGERVVFPKLDLAAQNDDEGDQATESSPESRNGVSVRREAARAKRPRPERMVEVQVGHQSARSPEPVADVEHLIPPILGAVRSGRCVQALSALDHVSRAVDGRVPRSALWLTAYCQRKLGNLESSRRLFARYGAGPWAVPTGDELPPLP